MKESYQTIFLQVAFTHFVLCFFLGIITLFFIQDIFPNAIFRDLLDNNISLIDIAIATVNGIFVCCCVIAYHLRHNQRVRKGIAWNTKPDNPQKIQCAAIIAFTAGAFDIIFGLHSTGIIALTLFVLAILIWHLRQFTREVVCMLEPGSVITWSEVAELLRIYLNMLAGFTLINATLEVAHLLTDTPPPFGFGVNQGQLFIDSLYYTVVTMTTLGFGDIVPKSWDAKLLLIFQCIVSYVMFALMVGIVTRGVVKTRPAASDSTEKTT